MFTVAFFTTKDGSDRSVQDGRVASSVGRTRRPVFRLKAGRACGAGTGALGDLKGKERDPRTNNVTPLTGDRRASHRGMLLSEHHQPSEGSFKFPFWHFTRRAPLGCTPTLAAG